jgi:hypothetical protein
MGFRPARCTQLPDRQWTEPGYLFHDLDPEHCLDVLHEVGQQQARQEGRGCGAGWFGRQGCRRSGLEASEFPMEGLDVASHDFGCFFALVQCVQKFAVLAAERVSLVLSP